MSYRDTRGLRTVYAGACLWALLACGTGAPPVAETPTGGADALSTVEYDAQDASADSLLEGSGDPEAWHAEGPGQVDDFMFDEVALPPATFMMGAITSEGKPYREIELPPRPVTISHGLSVGTTEVTQGLWHAVTGETPSTFRACGPWCPVESITLYEALAFANALSEAQGLPACYSLATCRGERWSPACEPAQGPCVGSFSCAGIPTAIEGCTGYRVPTEAEWEYLARPEDGPYGLQVPDDPTPEQVAATAGWYANIARVSYPGAQLCHDRAHLYPCGPQPGGLRTPNASGLWDVTGNVREWTVSRTHAFSYGHEPVTDPLDFTERIDRIAIRGGSYADPLEDLRVTHRAGVPRTLRHSALGLRLVRSTFETELSTCARGHRRPSGACIEHISAGPFAPCATPIGPASPAEVAWITAHWGEAWVDAERSPTGWVWPDGSPISPTPKGVGACLSTSADGVLRARPCEVPRAQVCATR